MRKTVRYMLIIVLYVVTSNAAFNSAADKLQLIKLPSGFEIEIYTDRVPGARSLAVSPTGTLFVAQPQPGQGLCRPG